MRDLLSWNISFGRWAGMDVRLHVFFILFAVVAIHFGLQHDSLVYMLAVTGILLLSVAVHEFGHCVGAWRVGRPVDQLMLWPLGGLTNVGASHHPHHEFVIALSGPIMNLAVCALSSLLLLRRVGELPPLLNPLAPPMPATDGSVTFDALLDATFWINWVLAVVNLLPAIPLDGSRALRALLWPKLGYRTAVLVTSMAAQGTAVALWMAAWLVHGHFPFATLPLALLGVLVFFAARQEAERVVEAETGAEQPLSEDFSTGFANLQTTVSTAQPRQPGLLRRWLEQRKADRERQRQERERDEERRVDEILARLHVVGRDGLSLEDRELLDRVSRRLRDRGRD
ncbi:MAG: hypothetical protein JSS27_16560 [Planctomycetes bacterium]|nr:hypothetical protein [Planctomycetota bacterium]